MHHPFIKKSLAQLNEQLVRKNYPKQHHFLHQSQQWCKDDQRYFEKWMSYLPLIVSWNSTTWRTTCRSRWRSSIQLHLPWEYPKTINRLFLIMKKLKSSDKHYYSMPELNPPSKYVKKFKLLRPAFLNSLQKFQIAQTYPKTTSVIYFFKIPIYFKMQSSDVVLCWNIIFSTQS